jgi:hypothetical protein
MDDRGRVSADVLDLGGTAAMEAATPAKDFKALVAEGIPDELPPMPPSDPAVSHAPARRQVLTRAEKGLSIRNALRYFPRQLHA